MKHLQQVIDTYLLKQIPFAVFKYPNDTLKIVAQYASDFLIDSIDFNKEGFIIHPFIKDEEAVGKPEKSKTPKTSQTPIAFIKPDVFTSNFEKINLTEVPQLNKPGNYLYNETVIEYASYKNTLKTYLNLLNNNTLQKIIASRIVLLPKIETGTITEKLQALCDQHPKAFCYIFNLPGIGLWLGATPEILLSYKNNLAETVALAGTKKLNENTNWSNKEIEEQAIVANYIENVCQNLDLKIQNKSKTKTITSGKIQHLKTTYRIEIMPNKVADLVTALHPTPAVGGLPKQMAIQTIVKNENYDRQYYTGFLGMNFKDQTQLYVNLRCAKLNNINTFAFAGGGITKDSNIKSEWGESITKSKVIANIL